VATLARVRDDPPLESRVTKLYASMPSPIGELLLVGAEESLREIRFLDVFPQTPDVAWRRDERALREARRQLEAYFAGELREFDLTLDPRGTEFQRRVWSELERIPWGETISYGELARRIGRPDASRAVGAANGRNPIPIVIPCHRVIGADGSLTGYGGGLPIKRKLLSIEKGV
jgi:methylated-DNA-[protein]-cysteine S-methyltransferase